MEHRQSRTKPEPGNDLTLCETVFALSPFAFQDLSMRTVGNETGSVFAVKFDAGHKGCAMQLHVNS